MSNSSTAFTDYTTDATFLQKPCLDKILKTFKEVKLERNKKNELLKQDVIHAANKFTESTIEGINRDLTQIVENQRILESEIVALESQCSKFLSRAKAWDQAFNRLNRALKEVGDIENWANIVEDSMNKIVSCLEYIRENSKKSSIDTSTN